MMIFTDAVFVLSSTDVAVMVALCTADEPFEGAAYVTNKVDGLVNDPGPFRLHDTPRADGSLVSVAVTCTDSPWSVCAVEADSWTEIGGAELEQEHAKPIARNPRSAVARWSFTILEILSLAEKNSSNPGDISLTNL